MLNKIKILTALAMGTIFILTACKSNNMPTAPTNSIQKSSTVLLSMNSIKNPKVKLNTNEAGRTSSVTFDVIGGTLDLTQALINFKNLRIEENSGYDGEQQGDHQDGDQNDNEGGTESETPDVTAPGPFSADLSAGLTTIGNFSVPAGTFKKVDFNLTPNSADPFFGKTIVMNGNFSPTQGSSIPFTLKSELLAQLQLQIANGGITVQKDSTVNIDIVIDLPALFSNLDLSSAQIVNGELSIDSQHNAALLTTFEANIAKYIDAEEGDGK